MLHIKLPKGKVAQACERAAEEATRRIVVANARYRSELEIWRKAGGDLTDIHQTFWIAPPYSNDVGLLTQDRDMLHRMADMCKHSVGDVYISPDLWQSIKGVY